MAVWLLARTAGFAVPRRLVYVVDRRAVVDQATAVAMQLADRLAEHPDIAERLGITGGRLPVALLRGGLGQLPGRSRAWHADLASPAIIVGTVDMIGSRLLFGGYGVSRGMRPVHAAFVGCDSLVVLDEAHLVPPFRHLLADLPAHAGGTGDRQEVPPLRLLALSATGRTGTGKVLGLTTDDLDDRIARQRLTASKALSVRPPADRLVDALVEEAWALTGGGQEPRAVIIYCNAREMAQKVHAELAKRLKGAGRVALFTGARRGFERNRAQEDLLRLGFLPDDKPSLPAASFLVATSAAEVGVDLDADDMVADAVAFERLVQRFGRVNRRGDGAARLIIVPERAETGTPAAEQRAATVNRALDLLKLLPARDDGSLDASPKALADLRAANLQAVTVASTPEPLRPALTRALVDAWAMTSLDAHSGRPDIDPWLRGWVEEEDQTRVAWRTHLPVCEHQTDSEGSRFAGDDAEAFFESAPIQPVEELETETWRVLEWLIARAGRLFTPDNAADWPAGRPVAFVLTRGGKLKGTWTRAALEAAARKGKDAGRDDKRAKDRLERELQGATLVIDARFRGLSAAGYLDPAEAAPFATGDAVAPAVVADAAPEGATAATGPEGKAPEGEALEGMAPGDYPLALPFRVRPGAPDEVRRRPPRDAFVTGRNPEGAAVAWLEVLQIGAGEGPADGLSRTFRRRANQTLAEHTTWVEEEAARVAAALGLEPMDRELLCLAARLHDRGKASPRWQRAMGAPGDQPYAKIGKPEAVRGSTNGYRHEFGSTVLARHDPAVAALPDHERDLVLHLIAAHHGHARPVLTAEGYDGGPASAFADDVAGIALRFARLQRRLGPWRLAWWETLLRVSDHAASAAFDKVEG